jgi:branched-chain amino acid transport system ATP-binding protein
MLKASAINTFYGKIRALWDISFRIKEKEIVTVVGNNGAGKSTLLKTIAGLVRPHSGNLEFLGRRIDMTPPHKIVKMGISLVPEGGKLFPDMTVRENLEMGSYIYESWKRKEETLGKVYQIFPILEKRGGQLARTLSGGERQMLAMGRSLMAKPRLCMLDEPSYGLSPLLVAELFKLIERLHEQEMTILVVEQNILHALKVSSRGYVLENGRIVMHGQSADLLENEYITKAYLGL